MEIKKITSLNGAFTVPGDKSISHRAIMFGAICDGVSHITGFLNGADCLSTIECFRQMGVQIDVNNDAVTVYGKGLHGLKKPDELLYTGNSGTTTRLLCGLLCAQDFECDIAGDESIAKRPMKRVCEPLRLMGAKIDGDYCPLHITGKEINGIDYHMMVASAQVKTALILAAMYANGKTTIHELEKSRDHTELMLRAMGANIEVDGLNITIDKTDRLNAQDIKVPGDISSAAFFMVLGAILKNSEITIKNVGINPTRTGIIDVLLDMGADITLENKRVVTGEQVADIKVRSSKLKAVTIGGDIIPRLIDELPIIAVASVFAEGKTVIKDAQELKVKETNRIFAVVNEFKKCGVDIKETDDGMIINGNKPIHGADFKTYGDHRMAMSLTVLAQMASGISTIDDDKCVSVSYPSFFDDLYGLSK
ncbi:MAG: 3-phosphoshikimate 1-carboxyvinyltransferase [Clostridia bacterium]|nr:3-phosphoshikimate 1-carboxyvinyltransferase [Clostridia bacterium]